MKTLKKSSLLLIFLVLTFMHLKVYAIADDALFNPVTIKDGMTLSVLDCVSNAFKNSPIIRRQKYNLDIAKSNVGIARSQYFPVINVGAGFYNVNNSDNKYYEHHYRELPSVGVTVNKLVWDFGKTTAYIKIEEFYKLGAEYEFMDSLCSTLFDVKLKYYNLLRAKAKLDIAERNIEINKDLVKISQGNPDLTAAKIYLNSAKIRYSSAERNYRNEKINLDNSMYLDNQPEYDISDTNTFSYKNNFDKNIFEPIKFNFPLDKAVEIAYQNSPNLQVLTATKHAMEESLKFIKKTYMPDLTANVGYGLNNSTQTLNNSIQVGVNLNSNVNIMELRHSIKGADAQINLADNEILLFKKDLYFEVKKAFNNVEKAQEQIPTAKLEVLQSLENLKLVEDKYKSRELDYTALHDSKEDYIQALNDYVDCLYNYNIALIQVEQAMHYHIVDIHHRSDHAVHFHSDELIEHLNKVLGCDKKEVGKGL